MATLHPPKRLPQHNFHSDADKPDDMTAVTLDENGSPVSSSSSSSSSKSGLWRQVFQAMNPAVCLNPAGACANPLVDDEDEKIDYEYTMRPILKELQSGNGKVRTTALQKLFKLTDKDSQQHRVPVVCSTSFDTMGALLPCLSPNASPQDRRQALLLLNNLCIPQENKIRLLNGENRDALLSALLLIFQKRLAETHLAAACLYNLSFLEEAKLWLLTYIPMDNNDNNLTRVGSARSSYSFRAPSQRPNSLLRIVEDLTSSFTPYMSQARQKGLSSVEAATIRWCMALLRNLVTVRDNAILCATTTQFPQLAADYLLHHSHEDLAHWGRDSLEDSSLLFLLLLVQQAPQRNGSPAGLQMNGEQEEAEICKAMDSVEMRMALDKVGKYPGIHGVRAGVILHHLDEAREKNRLTQNQSLMDEDEDDLEAIKLNDQDSTPDEKKTEDHDDYDRGTMASF